MIILAVDPHFSKKKLPYAYALFGESIKIGIGTLLDLPIKECDKVVIEDQFMSKNYKTTKGLSWSAGKVMGLAEYFGKEYDIINVATWKAYFSLLKKDISAWDQAQTIYKDSWGDLAANDDVASAVCMGYYYIHGHHLV